MFIVRIMNICILFVIFKLGKYLHNINNITYILNYNESLNQY